MDTGFASMYDGGEEMMHVDDADQQETKLGYQEGIMNEEMKTRKIVDGDDRKERKYAVEKTSARSSDYPPIKQEISSDGIQPLNSKLRRGLGVAMEALESWKRKGTVPWEAVERVVESLMRMKDWHSAKNILRTFPAASDDPRYMNMYATVLNELGELDAAAQFYERLEKMQTDPTRSDEVNAVAAGGFGKVLMKQGQYDRAVTRFQCALGHFTRRCQRRRSCSNDYLDSVFWRAELARAYMKLKKFGLAFKEQQRVVEDLLACERSSTTLTRSLLIAKENLALIYWHLEEPEKAEEAHAEVLANTIETYGEGVDSWKVMSRMAEELFDSEPDRAVHFLERVVIGKMNVFGEDDEETLSSKAELVKALQRSAENEEQSEIGQFW